jgi:hypothetical protein
MLMGKGDWQMPLFQLEAAKANGVNNEQRAEKGLINLAIEARLLMYLHLILSMEVQV